VVGQLGAMVGIVFSLWFLNRVGTATEKFQSRSAPATNAAPASVAEINGVPVVVARKSAGRRGESGKRPPQVRLARLVAGWPDWVFPLLTLLDFAGLGFYVVPVVFTAARQRLAETWALRTVLHRRQ